MSTESVLPRGFKAEAERIAEKCRLDLGLTKIDALDASLLANFLDIEIYSVDEIFLEDTDNLQYTIMNDPAKFSAMWTSNQHNKKIIIHNTNHSKLRQQSNLMHELAHIIRKHEISDEIAKLCAQLGLHYYNKLHEQEAKYLGGSLQITRAALEWSLKKNLSVDQISEYYNASVDMVKYRIGITGVQKQLRYLKNYN